MAYRPKWFDERERGRGVLGIALDLHTGITDLADHLRGGPANDRTQAS